MNSPVQKVKISDLNMSRIIHISIAVLISLMLFICTSCKKKNDHEASREDMQKEQGIPVELVTVKKGDIFITVDVSGELNADEKLTVNTNNTGTVVQLLIEEGDEVKAGQLLAVIEPNDIEDQLTQARAVVNTASLRLTQAQSKALLQITQVEGAISQAEAVLKAVEAQYEQARAGLVTAQEQLSLVEEGARRQEIAVAEAAVSQAEANFRQAKVDLGRMERLYQKGAISKQQLDMAQVQYDVAQAQYNSALHRLDLIKEGARTQEKESARQQVQIAEEKVTAAFSAVDQAKVALKIAEDNRMQVTIAREDVAVAQDAVNQARANLDIITRKLEKSYVKSPINGYVTKRYVDLGMYAGGQGPSKIADVFNPKTMYFEAIVSDTDIKNITPGLKVNIKIDSYSDKHLNGFVKEIIPIGSSDSRQFTVKITIHNGILDLKPGMFARGEVILSVHKDVPVIPKDTIKTNDGKQYVYIVDNLHVAEREISFGPAMGGLIEIVKGLTPGEKVIYSGTVKKGDLLKIISEE